jgi:hypothetical protein
MEVADALYGISIQPGGASKVLSERPGVRGSRRIDPTPAGVVEARSPTPVA